MEFLGTLDKLDVKGLEPKNEWTERLQRKCDPKPVARMGSDMIHTSPIQMRYTA